MDNNTPWTEGDVSERLRNLFGPKQVDPSPTQRAFHEAAAVLVDFEMHRIRPVPGGEPSEEAALDALASDSEICYNAAGGVRWTLRLGVRQEILRMLLGENRVRQALDPNRDAYRDILQQQFEAYLTGQPQPLAAQNLEELRGTERAVQLLEGLVSGLPDPETLRRRIALEALLRPFRQLAGEHFAGREAELDALSGYVGVFEAQTYLEMAARKYEETFGVQDRPTLCINGPGGIGKSSLVARFVLNHVDRPRNQRFPFAYLDFDRPGLVAEEPITLLFEAMRQLETQYPDASARVAELRKAWNERIASQESDVENARRGGPDDLRLSDRDYFLESFGFFVESLQVGDQPLLVVLDTFEEIQLQNEALVDEVLSFLAALQQRVPRLRTVLSGRVLPNTNYPLDSLPLTIFDARAAAAYLENKAKVSPQIAAAVAAQVGGSPMTLKLAVDVLKQEAAGPRGISGLRTGLVARLWGETVQSQLYTRILGHIKNDEGRDDEDVQKLAHPGLILRRITPPIIKDVLAGPCGVPVPDDATARSLFNRLARQVVLVTREGLASDVLIHRPDLRTVMLAPLRASAADTVIQIHSNAVNYYTRFDDSASRAEEFYHRLSLGIDRTLLNERWIDTKDFKVTMRKAFLDSLRELPDEAQAYLASRLELEIDTRIWQKAAQDDWERYASRQAETQLGLGKPADALRVIRERDKRTWIQGGSLFPIEVDALIAMARRSEAQAAVDQAIQGTQAAGRIQTPAGQRLLEQQRVLRGGGSAPAAGFRRSARHYQLLSDALLDALPSREVLDQLLLAGVGAHASQITSPSGSLAHGVFQVISWADANGRLDDLVFAARREFPGNARLFRAAQELGLEVDRQVEYQFEQLQRANEQSVDIDVFRRQLSVLDGRVCRIRTGGKEPLMVTGFLVGPDLVLTADLLQGPLANLMRGPLDPRDLVVQFDRRHGERSNDRIREARLAPEWLIEAAPGFSLVRLDADIGRDRISSRDTRGWLAFTGPSELSPGAPLLIVHQDENGPALSLATNGIVSVDPDGAWFQHKVNVPPSAAGAPCFDASFQLLGVHAPAPGSRAPNNAVAVSAVMRTLKERGKDKYVQDRRAL